MTLEQKIGQHFMGHIPRAGVDPEMLANIEKGLYGGFILYPWNYKTEDDVRALTQKLQTAAAKDSPPIELFLSADQEGGRVAAFRFPHFVQFPAAFYIGEYHDIGMAWSNGYINAVELRSLGLNMNFAPVLGIYPKPDSTIIGDRSMGPNVNIVSALGQAYIWGAEEGGIIPVAKHFPGHGAATLDSHYDLPVVEYTRDELMAKDIRPFIAAIDAGVEVIMTAHILYPKIDSTYPVTLSTIFLRDILRKQLGFQGVVITDGLSMGALSKHFPLKETLKRAFDAGADILLDHAVYDVPSMVKEVEAMVHDGEIPMATVDDGTRRVLLLKLRHGLILPQTN
ncbi:MAG TPA: glycoside hydrolase family 3 protein [Spirochaetia bacterium]|nr:glycoside hydrolase family 3 protein [Spirochaetia bacterium]